MWRRAAELPSCQLWGEYQHIPTSWFCPRRGSPGPGPPDTAQSYLPGCGPGGGAAGAGAGAGDPEQ